MYHRLCNYLSENNLIYVKQFGFKAAHSAEHAILQLVSRMLDSFNEDKLKQGISIDLKKIVNIYLAHGLYFRKYILLCFSFPLVKDTLT